jgi:predicted ABC-type ATPase
MAVPDIILLAGPNGAGKTTISGRMIGDAITFLNADLMAAQMAASGQSNTEIAAGRLLLARWNELERQHASFAVETTLATRSFAPRIDRMRLNGYRFRIIFLWISDVEVSLNRVHERVARGGHSIPEEVIRRRYMAGIKNFFDIYQPLADTWRLYDTSQAGEPELVAWGRRRIVRSDLWSEIQSRR